MQLGVKFGLARLEVRGTPVALAGQRSGDCIQAV